ncbi:MAG: HPr family phosphocarrier protein [Clostridiales bacterium]|nr:HPr family phosphocarrier protein [Clostridiales bacterium]
MKEFEYTIRDRLGIHARPASMITKKASMFESKIELQHKGKTIDMKRIFSLMSLAIKYNDCVKVTIWGKDEEEAYGELVKLFDENL